MVPLQRTMPAQSPALGVVLDEVKVMGLVAVPTATSLAAVL